MKKTLIAVLSTVTAVLILCSAVIAGRVSDGFDDSERVYSARKTSDSSNGSSADADNDPGSLKVITSSDGSTVTFSYDLNGETVSYTVPNNANYTSGGFAGTDDLQRTLPTALTTGIYGSNGEHYVGMFYFLWQGEHGDSGVYDLQKILDTGGKDAYDATSGLFGPVGAMHWFAEPLYGYYYANDEWKTQKHMELLSNSNVDFLYFDVTNGFIYKDNALQVMKICHELNEQGFDAPQVVFYTHTNSAGVMRQLYDEIYSKGIYEDTWFRIDGKPCIVGVEEGNIDNFFTVKADQWPNEATKNNSWPWMDFEWPQRVFTDKEGKGSAISVSVAQHNGTVMFSDSSHILPNSFKNRGRSFNSATDTAVQMRKYMKMWEADKSLTNQGLNFQAQWDRAIEANVPYILVTGWNEWVAQRQNGEALRGDPKAVCFVDTSSMEFSRDLEMMRGGYFDNYYMQLISNVQRLKGSAPVIVQDSRRPIDVNGAFDQWNDVLITYVDPAGDCKDREAMGFGKNMYKDYTGRNDIVNAKVTSDSKNVYFYVKTNEDIVLGDGKSSWMQLFVNTDNNSTNGWYGYDYIINYSTKGDTVTTVAKCNTSDGSYGFEICGEVNYKVSGNEMMISVPMEMLGIEKYKEVYIEFKWADADEETYFTNMEDFYTFGDAAPLGRLNWIYQNYIPGVTKNPEEETQPDTSADTDEPVDTEIPTETPTTADETETGVGKEKKGCKSVAVGGTLVIVSSIAVTAMIGKKKKYNKR